MRLALFLSTLGLVGCIEDGSLRGCSDGFDNDGDGLTDCDDPNCNDRPVCRWGIRRDSGFFDTDMEPDPNGYTGPWRVDTISWDCVGTAWSYEFVTQGWAYGMDLSIEETSDDVSPWSEFHFTDNLEYAEDGTWDVWGVTLAHVTQESEVVTGQTTLFECGLYSPDNLGWMVVMRGSSGEELDCAVWGFEADAYFNGQLGNSCVVFSP